MAEWGEFTIEVFGSAANSLWTKESDIDLEISLPDFMDENPCNILSCVQAALEPISLEADKVFGSRIPLIKVSLDNPKAEVDISVNNPLAIHNSRLLYSYFVLDQRVHILCKSFKLILKQNEVLDGSKRYLSTYCMCMMVIAYL